MGGNSIRSLSFGAGLMLAGAIGGEAHAYDPLWDTTPVESCVSYFDEHSEFYFQQFLYGAVYRETPDNLVALCSKEREAEKIESGAQFRFAAALFTKGYVEDAIAEMERCSDTIVSCQIGLALMLMNTLGYAGAEDSHQAAPKDPERAMDLLMRAIAADSKLAGAYMYFVFIHNSEKIEMTDTQLDFAMAGQFSALAADEPLAWLSGSMLAIRADKDEDEIRVGLEKLEELSDGGVSFAMVVLGYVYERGEIVTADGEIARGWYEKAAVLGDVYGMHRLSEAYLPGEAPFQLTVEEAASWMAHFVTARRVSSGRLDMLNRDPDWRVQFAEYLDE